ncbi:Formimidoylglutamase [Arenibacter antarcticus]|uniref:Formimidoylglutamase n=1 Tax=Arenibacter antarcticus TaxID=2040469 RepID=A0ABW5VA29_9FLAO|nr:formimidoylglutamase [Arenibacter sp. H213]MCM4167722.1 formimidoylglutamase [Arenibacter sp. H213]
MKNYIPTNPEIWTGRTSDKELYLHEKVRHINLKEDGLSKFTDQTFAILGYVCDEGVKRNQGRIGASEGPDAIRKQLAKMPNHLSDDTALFEMGNIQCINANMEAAQSSLAETVSRLLELNTFPILLGGGHDIAYGHFNGIKNQLASRSKNKTIGIVNFDAHFDLRSNKSGNNSGTPFYQIAQDLSAENTKLKYLCLGIRKDANIKSLFDTAKNLNVGVIENKNFNLHHLANIKIKLERFIKEADYLCTTIDLDGFSSAYAPGVSAPSPMGFSPEIVMECLEIIRDSEKMISLDIAEMNPTYDIDDQTAKLAASLIHFVLHQ